MLNRRDFLKRTGAISAAVLTAGCASMPWGGSTGSLYEISLAQWSLNREFFGRGGAEKRDPLDFAKIARGLGIGAIEYVNQFYMDKARDAAYLAELNKRAAGEGVKNVLIMCDHEGDLGDPDDKKRATAVDNHVKWLEAAKTLGCHSIRVNARSSGAYDEQIKLAADGLQRLSTKAKPFGLNVIVENHGGLSSNGAWLAKVMTTVNLPNCGTLPDFGNFRVSKDEMYDRYKGVSELMPFAKAVSAKTHEFDEAGNEKHTDYLKMMKIVTDAGYHGYVGIEFEGGGLSSEAGILKTKALLERVRDQLSA